MAEELWNQSFSFATSAFLKCAVELGVPDAIHSHGGAITLPQLATAVSVPIDRLSALRHLMRALVRWGCFAWRAGAGDDGGEYLLTPMSRLLLSSKQTDASPFVLAMFHPVLLQPWQSLSAWFSSGEPTPFAVTHGKGIFELMAEHPDFAGKFVAALDSDSRLVGEVIVREHRELFDGARSLVDVGGCTGALATIFAEAFPGLKCTVFDLPHMVTAAASTNKGRSAPENLDFVGGDMFEHIPSADLLVLKWILHDWSDADCVKILKRCKEAIPAREKGGKVIIIEIVLRADHREGRGVLLPQLFFDMLMMADSGGMEREEDEWRRIFIESGYSEYKITPLGARSLIELYP